MSHRLPLVMLCLFASGCATITHDANQQVQIDTYSKNQERIMDAKCSAKNERGEWAVTTPGAVSVHRSAENLIVRCEKDGQEPGTATVISRANGGMFGNILIGGGIGAIIDHNKGTAYNYPSWLKIIMGESLIFDKRDESDETRPSPSLSSSAIPGNTAR